MSNDERSDDFPTKTIPPLDRALVASISPKAEAGIHSSLSIASPFVNHEIPNATIAAASSQ